MPYFITGATSETSLVSIRPPNYPPPSYSQPPLYSEAIRHSQRGRLPPQYRTLPRSHGPDVARSSDIAMLYTCRDALQQSTRSSASNNRHSDGHRYEGHLMRPSHRPNDGTLLQVHVQEHIHRAHSLRGPTQPHQHTRGEHLHTPREHLANESTIEHTNARHQAPREHLDQAPREHPREQTPTESSQSPRGYTGELVPREHSPQTPRDSQQGESQENRPTDVASEYSVIYCDIPRYI